jgi:membrane protein DedA with SNARE-associated domain
MRLMDLLATYGYLAVLVGSLLEGESMLVLAGFAAHQGRLFFPAVLLIAFVAGTLGDQLFFWVGRAWGTALLRRFPAFERRAHRVRQMLHRHDALLIVCIRFLYGLRVVGPMAMGASGVAGRRFAAFNLLGAAIWAILVGGFGYLVAGGLEAALGDLGHYDNTILGLMLAVMVVAVAVRVMRRQASHAWHPDPQPTHSTTRDATRQ